MLSIIMFLTVAKSFIQSSVKHIINFNRFNMNSINVNRDPENIFSSISIGGMRKLSIKIFKNVLYVDIREYFEDELGDQKPGVKGISLNINNWNLLCGTIGNIDEEMEKDSDSPFEFDLGNLKKVTISNYRGKMKVDIRKYYIEELTKEEKPST